jgi:pyruvate dehydrogenase complex dehydrogenase (E1) component
LRALAFDLDKLKNFRALGGAQSYPSRTKDGDFIDFSTGSVGLGAAATVFASLTQDGHVRGTCRKKQAAVNFHYDNQKRIQVFQNVA